MTTNKLLNQNQILQYSINLLQIENELNSPKLKALTKQAYQIKAIIPVENQGVPTAILIMQKNLKTLYTPLHYKITTKLLYSITILLLIQNTLHLFTLLK